MYRWRFYTVHGQCKQRLCKNPTLGTFKSLEDATTQETRIQQSGSQIGGWENRLFFDPESLPSFQNMSRGYRDLSITCIGPFNSYDESGDPSVFVVFDVV